MTLALTNTTTQGVNFRPSPGGQNSSAVDSLADVATIFLPISFLAGFWGQNFDVLTGSIEKGWSAFLVLGVGLSVACVA